MRLREAVIAVGLLVATAPGLAGASAQAPRQARVLYPDVVDLPLPEGAKRSDCMVSAGDCFIAPTAIPDGRVLRKSFVKHMTGRGWRQVWSDGLEDVWQSPSSAGAQMRCLVIVEHTMDPKGGMLTDRTNIEVSLDAAPAGGCVGAGG